ncbi:4-(cytidine 5'-diphospho)-2-C-methyl-D-erythritol kinase [Parapedobacter sp. SGR-10]|uniref:4-(cytidine 5'-diphospho)-2-C-methyl-D-erythritol kinase n=1 Tax=Parapedobacter sp. SGR-10 TaxID=2710879 RepID=UPI0013D747E7|nr:4-(cytidine 5'-diphospho)-2-C-methyl-D-erythritol kinase [Parapedobacter sp. SGR-10]NGF57763.1 4-(cytidine 5'-diphospho)-2-C-methyl-D-erythritol kinase [Parapedobacter sp. SGR-10]
MLTFANAKINLGLLVTEKRQDGYHNIETIFYPVKLYDVIEVNVSKEFRFRTQGLDIPSDGQNLCEKAYRLLQQDFDLKPVTIDLLKNIPIGAGLGGGSSDGAHVLKLLNGMNELGLSNTELKAYATQLGADCPFFIDNQPMFASGIGTTFESVHVDLSAYYIVLIKPDIHISTAEAYQYITPQTPTADLRRAIRLPIQEWKYHLVNDFELGTFEKYPLVEKIKHTLYKKGALYAAMSGSGSAVFGIFEEEINLDDMDVLGKVYYPVEV